MKRYMVIYMAAGNSRRFGSNKLLYELEGKPLYRHGLETLLEFCDQRENVWLTVITQYEVIFRDVETLAAGRRRVSVFLNPDSRKGVSHTIRRGLLEAERLGEFDYFLFVTADQPWIGRGTLEQFLQAGERGNFPAVSACLTEKKDGMGSEKADGTWNGVRETGGEKTVRLGNPVMFCRELKEELLALRGDEGGRKVWKRYAGQGGLVEAESGRELEDLDFCPGNGL